MGDVVLAIQRSQRTPYPYIQKNEEVQRLVLDAKMFDEEVCLFSILLFLKESIANMPFRNYMLEACK